MTRNAMNSVLALVLVSSAASAATVVKPVVKPAAPGTVVKPAAPAATVKPAAPAVPAVSLEVEAMIRDAAQLEKSDGCEAAYLKYRQAGDKTALVQGRRAAELQGIV